MIKDRLIAHRGWQHRFPENTLLAVEQALLVGAKHVEIDIQISADGVAMLCHDDNLLRFCGVDKNINECSQSQLAELSAYEPERLGEQFLGNPLSSLLQCVELLAQYPETTLYVEIKEESLAYFGIDRVLAAILPVVEPIMAQCQFLSFDLPVLHALKQRGINRVVPVFSEWQPIFSEDVSTLTPTLLFINQKLFRKGRQPKDLPYPCACYEVGDLALAERLISQGAAMIETFRIGELMESVSTP